MGEEHGEKVGNQEAQMENDRATVDINQKEANNKTEHKEGYEEKQIEENNVKGNKQEIIEDIEEYEETQTVQNEDTIKVYEEEIENALEKYEEKQMEKNKAMIKVHGEEIENELEKEM